MHKGGCVYIRTNKNNTTLYNGVTSDLRQRIWQYQSKYNPTSFTAKYNFTKLVYYQFFITIIEAILVEKQIKAGSRSKKENLIKSINQNWDDLFDEIEW